LTSELGNACAYRICDGHAFGRTDRRSIRLSERIGANHAKQETEEEANGPARKMHWGCYETQDRLATEVSNRRASPPPAFHLCRNEHPATAFAIPFHFGRISNYLSRMREERVRKPSRFTSLLGGLEEIKRDALLTTPPCRKRFTVASFFFLINHEEKATQYPGPVRASRAC
jgi:hypothetical protein